jgi:hypothetical protein
VERRCRFSVLFYNGHFFCFRENDFARLKEMFSESYLAEIDKQEAAWQKSHAEQDALFE